LPAIYSRKNYAASAASKFEKNNNAQASIIRLNLKKPTEDLA
jgi:hypothetical protein